MMTRSPFLSLVSVNWILLMGAAATPRVTNANAATPARKSREAVIRPPVLRTNEAYIRSSLEIDRRPERPPRSPVARQQTAEEAARVVVVTAEVQEGVAVVPVDAGMAAHFDFQAASGVPAELGGTDLEVLGRAFERLDAALVPTRPAPEMRLKAAAGKFQEQRRLDWPLLYLLIEKLEVLTVTIEGHLDADPLGQAEADLTSHKPHRIGLDLGIGIGRDPGESGTDAKLSRRRRGDKKGQDPE